MNRTITRNPPDAYCDLVGTEVEILKVFRNQRDRSRAIAIAKITRLGPRYTGKFIQNGTGILIYRGITRKPRAAIDTSPKFQQTSCSQCGEEFGPGNHGYSHCADHGLSNDAKDRIKQAIPRSNDR